MVLAMGMAMVVTMAVLVITADGTAKDLPMPNLLPMPLLLPMPTLMPMPMHITEDTTDGEVTAEDTEDITVMDMATTDIGMAKDRPMPILTQMPMPMLTHITEDTTDTEDTAEDTEDIMEEDTEDIVDTTGDKNLV